MSVTPDGTDGEPPGQAGASDLRAESRIRPMDAERERRLSRFQPRPREQKVGAGYSRFVWVAKFVLPVVAVGILGIVALWPELQDLPRKDAPQAAMEEEAVVGEVLNPRFYSVDAEDRPYSIVADEADQAAGDSAIIDLDVPQAEMEMAGGEKIWLDAEAGTYNQTDELVYLEGNVVLRHEDGTVFVTETANVDIAEGLAWGDRAIDGEGPFGDIAAQGFRVFDEGATVVFTGRSRLILPQEEGDGG